MNGNATPTNPKNISRIEDVNSALAQIAAMRIDSHNSIQNKKSQISSHLEEQMRLADEMARLERACALLKEDIVTEENNIKIIVAKFLRDTNLTASDLEVKGIGVRNSLARDGVALSKLSPNLFSKLIDGNLPTSQGIAIGGSGLEATEQDKLYEMIGDRRVSSRAK